MPNSHILSNKVLVKSGNTLGLSSLALFAGAIFIPFGPMKSLPAISFLGLIVFQIAAATCSVAAAYRGSKLWLMLALLQMLFVVITFLSIFSEYSVSSFPLSTNRGFSCPSQLTLSGERSKPLRADFECKRDSSSI